MSRYALVDADSNVINVVEWDGERPFTPPEGQQLIADTDPDHPALIGGRYKDGAFTLPPDMVPPDVIPLEPM